ncbi:MAG: phosphoribosylaminoimidazolesuccinocarboxamide synthase [Erysipelotrichaceae bacterium]|nr:phosphoribosylaminoimidazolesuccinocarboxamide synthase [Erysipelotrichaceae bacterium]
MNNKYELIKFTDKGFELDVRADYNKDTVWLTQEEISILFDRNVSVISRHINAIFKENELDKNTSVHFLQRSQNVPFDNHRPPVLYNLDVIISVGYRVKSQRGVLFRQWASKILKDYLIKGYAVNQKRLNALSKTIDIQTRMLAYSLDMDKDELSKVINEYTRALDLLDNYDHQTLEKPKGTNNAYVMSYQECRNIIDSMKFNDMSDVFGVEKEEGKLNGIIMQVYQNVFGQELYPSIEEKAAHLLYFLVKDHPFADGCKRIAATLFINFLYKNNHLYRNNRQIISNEALVAITILTAESHPDEMDIIVKLIMNLLIGGNQ